MTTTMMFAESVTEICWREVWDVEAAAKTFARVVCERARSERLISFRVAAKLFGVSESLVYDACKRGLLYYEKRLEQYIKQSYWVICVNPKELAAYCTLSYVERRAWDRRRCGGESYVEGRLKDYERGKDTVENPL